VRTAVVWEILRGVLAEQAGVCGRAELDVVDAGGGTGGFAVPLAKLGHRVTVVDPSPDALASLERRAAEAGVRVHGVQGDADALLDAVGTGVADVVLCHSVLEYLDDPAAGLTAVAQAVRSDGAVSLLTAGRLAAVAHRALAGHFDEALRALTEPGGSWGERDPIPRRFTFEDVTALLAGVGMRVGAAHGIRVFADLVPGALLDGEPCARQALIDLELAAATHPVLRDVATQLHVVARR
jgi:SAM-dependent methyltransferase